MTEIEFIDKDIDKRIEKYGYGECLYHYTSIPVLYNILENKQFWLGSTAAMNDTKEVRYFIESLRDTLRKDLRDEISGDKLEQFDELFSRTLERIDNVHTFAMCFSKLDDDAAQWERYADNAKGVCIIFDIRNIMRVFYEYALLFCPVYYGSDIKQHQHYKLLYDYFKHGQMNSFDDVESQMDNAIACGYAHKHKSFKSEQEVRVINLWGKVPKYAKVETECVSGIIKRVLKFDMETRCKDIGLSFEDLFKGIVIGTRSKQDIHSLQVYLEEKGFHHLKNRVSKSDCPFR